MAYSVSTRKTPARLQLLDLLKQDLAWHHYSEIHVVAGIRYSARLLELKELGYQIESQPCEDGKWYRLRSRTPGPRRIRKVKVFLTEEDAAWLVDQHVTKTAPEATREALASYRERRDIV